MFLVLFRRAVFIAYVGNIPAFFVLNSGDMSMSPFLFRNDSVTLSFYSCNMVVTP
jgi:hypothetical protein